MAVRLAVRPKFKLNLGCGANKIEGCVNIDIEKACKPDLCIDFVRQKLPYQDGSCEEIYLFHTIEHIQKQLHQGLLEELHRLLCNGGLLYISYPNFWLCAQNWKKKLRGNRQFWEATLYGRQLFSSDFHVCAMDPEELEAILRTTGFQYVRSEPELGESYNTITVAERQPQRSVKYEVLLKADIDRMVVE